MPQAILSRDEEGALIVSLRHLYWGKSQWYRERTQAYFATQGFIEAERLPYEVR